MSVIHFAFAAAMSVQAPAVSPRYILPPAKLAPLSERSRKECGHAHPRDLMTREVMVRKKALHCLVTATVRESGSLLPIEIEPGAVITSASEFEGMLWFKVRLDPKHPRALAGERDTTGFDEKLFTRTCDDKWLGGLLDAGMEGDAQGGTAVLYDYQDKKSVEALVHCSDPK